MQWIELRGKPVAAIVAAAGLLLSAGLLLIGQPDSSASAVALAAARPPSPGSAPRVATDRIGISLPRLISIQPLSQVEGSVCLPASANASETLAQTLANQQVSTDGGGASSDASEIDREPLRVIRDTYATYSAIAVDTNSNEVYLQDENLFGYKVFNRLDNTPPRAAFTEPKRIVNGLATKMEYNCALYVDPSNGDVYSVDNDTMDEMVIFPREAAGNVAPMRQLHTPHGTYGIAVEEQAQELFLTVEHTNSVLVYPKAAKDEDKPLRTLTGAKTQLADPHGVAVDPKNKLLFVSNHGNYKDADAPFAGQFQPPSITVYPIDAKGDVAPLRVIRGPKAQLDWPAHIFVDPEHGELFVANDVGDSILVFRETDSGDAAPLRIVKGPRTNIKNPTGIFVDQKNDEVWVANMGNHSAVVFPRMANGNVAPRRIIRSAPAGKLALAIGNPGAAAYDSKRQEILVPN